MSRLPVATTAPEASECAAEVVTGFIGVLDESMTCDEILAAASAEPELPDTVRLSTPGRTLCEP